MPKINRPEVIDNCQFEWDRERGVLYVHNQNTGGTILRICGLPVTHAPLNYGQMIDITLKTVQSPLAIIGMPREDI